MSTSSLVEAPIIRRRRIMKMDRNPTCPERLTKTARLTIKVITLLTLLLSASNAAQAQGTAFTYQGRLSDGGNPANGSYDFRFALYTADTGGSQTGPTLTNSPVAANNGLFTATLDFGASRFD